MSVREREPVGLYITGLVAIAIIVGVGGYFGIQSTKIQAEKEKEITELVEKESTERTEERSQFWQKLIPWGEDESEIANEAVEDFVPKEELTEE